MITSRPVLHLFYREGCHLCEDLEQQLGELLDPASYHLIKIDIDESEQLIDVYNERVPVLECGGTHLCEHFLDLQAVSKALQQADASYNSAHAVP